jgi:hypothetical protein
VSRIADRDGVYYVAVRHCVYNGGNELDRLHVGTLSRPTAVFPPVASPAKSCRSRSLAIPGANGAQTVRLPTDGSAVFPFVAEEGGVLGADAELDPRLAATQSTRT